MCWLHTLHYTFSMWIKFISPQHNTTLIQKTLVFTNTMKIKMFKLAFNKMLISLSNKKMNREKWNIICIIYVQDSDHIKNILRLKKLFLKLEQCITLAYKKPEKNVLSWNYKLILLHNGYRFRSKWYNNFTLKKLISLSYIKHTMIANIRL